MYNDFLISRSHPFLSHFGWLLPVLILVLILWTMLWKGLALWNAARRKDTAWFVILLVFNTLGILELIYLFAVAKFRFGKSEE